jgi:hypothetical protein
MLVPTRWLGEGITVMANADQVRDAAGIHLYGYPLVYDLNNDTLYVAG